MSVEATPAASDTSARQIPEQTRRGLLGAARGGLTRRMLVAGALLGLVIGGLFALLVLLIADLRSSSRLTRDSIEVIAVANDLERRLIDLQNGTHGYVLSGQQRFLEPFRAARIGFPRQVSLLERQVAGYPAQGRRARAIARAEHAYIREVAVPLIETGASNPARARALVGEGGRRVEAVRAQVREFIAAERVLAARREAQARFDARRAIAIGAASLAVSLLLIALLIGYLARAIAAPIRRVAASADRLAAGDLAVRVTSFGRDEVGQLGQAFNAMAASLEESHDALARQNSAIAREKDRVERLYRAGRRLESESELGPFAETLLAECCDLAGAEVGALYVSQDERQPLELVAVRGREAGRLPRRLEAEAEEGASLVHLAEDGHLTDELRLPFRRAETTLGLLVLARSGRAFSPEERELVDRHADYATLALANVLSLHRASRQAGINEAVLDAAPVGIYLVDTEGTVLFANPAMEQLARERFGVLPVGNNLYELAEAIADEMVDPEGYRSVLAEIKADPELRAVGEYEFARTGRAFRRYTGPVRDGAGALLGRIFVLEEVTAERAADRLKSNLLATVSHELRTPLAGVLGFAELLVRRDLDAETRRSYTETIYSEARRLSGLVGNLLDLQRIEQGRFALAPEPFDLCELLRQKVDVYSGQSENHSLELALPAESLAVVADREQLGQVIGNLLSNAIKYSPEGGRIEVEATIVPEVVRVSVRDCGIGIPVDQQEHVFEKFFRVDTPEARRIGGTGLGLALCREIVEAHGGRIGFESAEREGSTFWLELPT